MNPRALAPLYVVARPIRLLLTYGPFRGRAAAADRER